MPQNFTNEFTRIGVMRQKKVKIADVNTEKNWKENMLNAYSNFL